MDIEAQLNKMINGSSRLVHRSLQSTNQEVNSIRLELDVANKKLKEISIIKDVCSRCQGTAASVNKLVEEKMNLSTHNRQLQKEIDNLKQQLNNSENRHKEAISALKGDRDRLRADKSELLSQIQETQKTIDDKEEQLREFIREFHQQMTENEYMIKGADEERIRLSKERNDLSRKYQDLIEVVATLRGELVSSEKKIRELEADLSILRHSSSLSQPVKRRSLHFTVDENLSTQRTITVTATEPNSSMQSHDPLLIPASPVIPRGYLGPNGAPETHCSSSSAEDVDGDFLPMTECLGQPHSRRPTKLVQQLSGSFSRAFRLGRNRKSLELASNADTFLDASPFSTEVWTDEEKNEILANIQNLPMQKWKADAVLVWLELTMQMPQYIKECQDNIKSGKVLLGLSESELFRYLGISNPLHCRKLTLAIDEFRDPTTTIQNTSPAGNLDNWWVCEQWLRDVALTQYTSRFREHLIDGRTLASLTRKDLEKFMQMDGRRTHQESVQRGVQLLQLLNFNKQRLDERRQMCENVDTDLLVWNNSRLIQWTKSIDLKEYSANLKDSGVHGALIVLDSNFTADSMASALGIPVNKASVRRHLSSEFETLVKQARESLEDEVNYGSFESGKKSSFSNSTSRFRRSIRSSISRTLGRQLSRENQQINIK